MEEKEFFDVTSAEPEAESARNDIENVSEEEKENLKAETPAMDPDSTEEEEELEKKFLFLKAAQGYGMIFGFGIGYVLSGILSEMGFAAGKFECVIICMFAGILISGLIGDKKRK